MNITIARLELLAIAIFLFVALGACWVVSQGLDDGDESREGEAGGGVPIHVRRMAPTAPPYDYEADDGFS